MKNLKQTSRELTNDIINNYNWLDIEISFVIDGSYGAESERLNKTILESYDISKPRRGKRGLNLIAQIGNLFIQKAYDCNSSQALSVWKYLHNEHKQILDNTVIDNLDNYIESNK